MTINKTVKINDETELDMKVFGKIGAYVMQDDILFQYFSPLEAITMAARLKLKVSIEE